jgi:hypothetical protein
LGAERFRSMDGADGASKELAMTAMLKATIAIRIVSAIVRLLIH